MLRRASDAVEAGSSFNVHVRICEGLGLAAADTNGRSDPYVKLKLNEPSTKGTKKYSTSVVKKELDPVFYETFTYTLTRLDDVLVMQVMDEDRVGRDDFLGRVHVPVRMLADLNAVDEYFPLMDSAHKRRTQGVLRVQLVFDATMFAFDPAAFQTHRNELFEQAFPPTLCVRRPLRVMMASWNVGNARPDVAELPQLLEAKEQFDLVVVGAQECEWGKVSEQYEYLGSGPEWFSMLGDTMGAGYELVESKSLLQMRIAVFARTDVAPLLRNVETDTEATGIGGIVGNKGGVAVAFSIFDTRLCFVNAHLAAHQHLCGKRNANYREIVRGINVGYHAVGVDIINQFHYLCFIGDLNYRVGWGNNGKEPTLAEFADVQAHIQRDDLAALYARDQLTGAIAAGVAFADFEDFSPLAMRPTFKVERGTRDIVYKPQRLPAWCDRIVCKCMPLVDLKHTMLECVPDLTTSDHKPVRAVASMWYEKLPVAVDFRLGACTLTFDVLHAFDLPVGDISSGSSDPYLYISGDMIPTVRTKTISKTLAPDWSSEKLTIAVAGNNPYRLKRSFINIVCYDKDVGVRDDRLCQTRLDMSHFFALLDGPYSFPDGYEVVERCTLKFEADGVYESMGSIDIVCTLSWARPQSASGDDGGGGDGGGGGKSASPW